MRMQESQVVENLDKPVYEKAYTGCIFQVNPHNENVFIKLSRPIT